MSDSAPVVAESAPVSSAEIAASVVESAEQESAATPEASESSPAATDGVTLDERPERTPEPEKAPSPSKAAEFLRKFGHEMKRSDGRRAFMPAETVAKMLDHYLEEHSTGWTTERATLETKAKQAEELQGYLDQFRQSVMGDPLAHLTELANNDPRYKAFLERSAAPAQTAHDAEMPQPDLPLADGSRTYSLEGLQKLLEWNTQKAIRDHVDSRLKPWEERTKAEQARAEHDEAIREINTRTQTTMQQAQEWPMFGKLPADGSLTDFQKEVLGELRKEREEATAAGRRPSMSLRQAYLEVESRYKTTDYNTVRERVLKEVQTAPRSPALARGAVDAPRAAGPRSSVDIVRKIVADAERAS